MEALQAIHTPMPLAVSIFMGVRQILRFYFSMLHCFLLVSFFVFVHIFFNIYLMPYYILNHSLNY